MVEIQLIRAAGDRRVYELGTIGSLRLRGWLLRWATAIAGDRSYRFSRATWRSAAVDATDSQGNVIATFRPNQFRRGGELRWSGTAYALRPAALLRERYELFSVDREVASIEARGWWGWGTRRPLTMRVMDHALDPGLLLFAAFVVRTLADKASSDTTAATSAANTGAYSG
jgi:hypothetical protein